MPTYVYEALNAAGKTEKGRIEAGSSDEAISSIRQQGFFPLLFEKIRSVVVVVVVKKKKRKRKKTRRKKECRFLLGR